MNSVNTSLNAYTQFGSAYSRNTAPVIATALSSGADNSVLGSNAATTLTLSDAARAQLARTATIPDFATIADAARTTLDQLYATAKVTGPIADSKQTINLESLDRRSLFAVVTNGGGKFTPAEQVVATRELKKRFDVALAPAAATTRLTGDYRVSYKAALDYFDSASPEEKASATWSAQRAAVLRGYQATEQAPTVAPSGIEGDPMPAYFAQNPTTINVRQFSGVADEVRAFLDAQKDDAAKNQRELVFDPQRKTDRLANLSTLDNRSLSAITLNQGQQFSDQEVSAAKQGLNSRVRASILDSIKQVQLSGDPRQLSLGILKNYSAMSPEERQAAGWTPEVQALAVKNYKSTSALLDMLQPA